MEIYALLRRILDSIPNTPTNRLTDDIKFIDALQREWNLPYTYFRRWEVRPPDLSIEHGLFSTKFSEPNVSNAD
jgi:hypothetical protein